MGGKINVESEFGKGSIFIVHIPQRIGSMTRPITDTQLINTSEIVKESRKKRVNYKTKSILIVDDNKLNIKVARRSLEQLNFKVIDECYNGKECVDKIKNNEKYDIILMDIMMPKLDGYSACKEIKKTKNIPVIMLSASDVLTGTKKVILLTKDGLSLGFPLSEVSELKKTSRGVKGITLEKEDTVAFATVVHPAAETFEYEGKTLNARRVRNRKRAAKGQKANLMQNTLTLE